MPKYVKGDPGRIRQILANLTGNAIKFTEDGEVIISCRLIKALESSYELRFSVQDAGIGIDKVFHAQLFDRFNQADNSIIAVDWQNDGTPTSMCILRQAANSEICINWGKCTAQRISTSLRLMTQLFTNR